MSDELVELVKEQLERSSNTLRGLSRCLGYRFSTEEIQSALAALGAEKELIFLGRGNQERPTTVYSLRTQEGM